MSETVDVLLGSRSYRIHIGRDLIKQAGALLAPLAHGVVPVVTDENVARLHLEELLASLRSHKIDARPIVLPAGESTKSFKSLDVYPELMSTCNVDRGRSVKFPRTLVFRTPSTGR